MQAWRPVVLLLLNFVVGWFVSRGLIDPQNHSVVVNEMADAVGYLIILVTSVATIIHAFKHPNHSPIPVESTTVTTTQQTKTETAIVDPPPTPELPPVVDPGTPPKLIE